MGSFRHHHRLDLLELVGGTAGGASFPFRFPSQASACPFAPFGFDSDLLDFDLGLIGPSTAVVPPSAFDLLDPELDAIQRLGDRVAALELGFGRAASAAGRRRWRYELEQAGGRRWSYEVEEAPARRRYEWEAEVRSPRDDGFDRKWKYAAAVGAAGDRKVKWAQEVKGKGWLEPWSQTYEWEELVGDEDEEEEEERWVKREKKEKKKEGKEKEKKGEKEKKKAYLVEIEDSEPAGAIALRKAFARHCVKGKKKELSPQDAALLIQMNFRAHLARRSQVLRCLRDLAVAKAKLKEIRSLFYNVSYRRRVANDPEERQRFSEKIIVLLLTVEALEGPDYMVRSVKKSMLEELEGMLEIVDPQLPGKTRSFRRRRFDLPEGGPVNGEIAAGVNEVVRIVEGK